MLWKIDRVKRYISAALSGVLLSLSFPNFNLEPFAFIAFVPLFFAVKGCTARKGAFILSCFSGIVFFGTTIFWLRHVSIPGFVLLVLLLSLFFGLFGAFFYSAASRFMSCNAFLLPAFWVVLEYIRSYVFTGFGWALLGYSQYLNLPLIQIADITGLYGISFLLIMSNLLFFNILSGGIRQNIPALFAALFIFFTVLSYGFFKLNSAEGNKRYLKISLIQGNIPQLLKWDEGYRKEILGVYSRLTREAAKEGPDLIIWPETALPGFIEEKKLLDWLKDLARSTGTYLLAGAPSYNGAEDKMFNSAILLSKKGNIIEKYDKLHLVPFGEYVPFEKYIKLLRFFINKPIGDFSKGREYTIFNLNSGHRFATLICFEDIFANLTRNFVSKGADFIVNITNDAWFMKTSAPYQHAQSSVFRAVENRVPVVRAANTGLSCFIDEYGRITDTVNIGGKEIFIEGYKTKKIYVSHDESFYNRFGDIFVFFCMASLIIKGALTCLKRY